MTTLAALWIKGRDRQEFWGAKGWQEVDEMNRSFIRQGIVEFRGEAPNECKPLYLVLQLSEESSVLDIRISGMPHPDLLSKSVHLNTMHFCSPLPSLRAGFLSHRQQVFPRERTLWVELITRLLVKSQLLHRQPVNVCLLHTLGFSWSLNTGFECSSFHLLVIYNLGTRRKNTV